MYLSIRHLVSMSLALSLVLVFASPLQADNDNQKLFAFDEHYWVLFYDLPSRRFRAIRDVFIKQEFESASRDLRVTENYLLIESTRASPLVKERLVLVAEKLATTANNIDQLEVTLSTLDALFARSHWLLSQHYLELALISRDTQQHRNCAYYLMATAHHVERSILWSNQRVEPKTLAALDSIWKLSNELLESKTPKNVYKERPVKKAWALIQQTGQFLDRKVIIDPKP
ncbi:MAG: hypothetical protein ACI82A_001783 [Candidatus Azotimanducaceae bacterium]|jgi:hypothetical protein